MISIRISFLKYCKLLIKTASFSYSLRIWRPLGVMWLKFHQDLWHQKTTSMWQMEHVTDGWTKEL